jgi:hypothetical protein
MTDSHFIIALPSRRRINRGRDVRFGNRVWLGKDGSVLECVASGIPTSVLMHDVAWLEERIYE